MYFFVCVCLGNVKILSNLFFCKLNKMVLQTRRDSILSHCLPGVASLEHLACGSAQSRTQNKPNFPQKSILSPVNSLAAFPVSAYDYTLNLQIPNIWATLDPLLPHKKGQDTGNLPLMGEFLIPCGQKAIMSTSSGSLIAAFWT